MSGKAGMFEAATITDAKRLVRGEHWLAVRTFLRQRDEVHHRPWKIVTVAGGAPQEELSCIRSLMPKAHIVAVDISRECCERAKAAGADEVAHADILDIPTGSRWSKLPPSLASIEGADAVNLDLCGPVTTNGLSRAVSFYTRRRGVLLTTFSYGREVAEIFQAGEYRGIPDPLAGRVRYIDKSAGYLQPLASAMAYMGKETPMCSLLWKSHTPGHPVGAPEFVRVADDDLPVAVSYPEAGPLYGLPAERVLAFRRRAAALKAVATRRRHDDGPIPPLMPPRPPQPTSPPQQEPVVAVAVTELRCGFCGKARREVYALIKGPGTLCICNECVGLCVDIVGEQRGNANAS